MSSHHDDADVFAAEKTWRELAQRANYDPAVAARLHQISLRQLERHCRRALGCTPREFFQRERMTRAALLLAAGQSAKSVTFELGYTDPANFTRAFKRHFSQPPTVRVPRPPFSAVPPMLRSAG